MGKMPVILVVDDEKNTREGLRDFLEDSFDVYLAGDAKGAMEILGSEPIELVVTDLRLGQPDGMELLAWIQERPKPPVTIMMTAYGSVDSAVDAMKRGAYDFVTKPVNLERLELLIKRALKEKDTRKENEELRKQIESTKTPTAMIGRSEPMVKILETIRQVAPSRATVLLEGESGTGKEVAAHAVHELSNRAERPFVAVHCAALSPQLLESELFGHERGAFTGAHERRIGRFEQANGGTLFLDEIGEIDPSTQVKILRVLGERTFERVGGNQTLECDVRLVAATNRSLQALVQEGKFRDDLFFRLNVVRLELPPLRERKEDIPLLVDIFLKVTAEENDKPRRELDSQAMHAMISYEWPGNVRELRAAVEHGVVMAGGTKITLCDLPSALQKNSGEAPALFSSQAPHPLNLQEQEILLIKRALEETEGNRTEAAKKLGISRRTLHRRLRELSLE
jgi:two-component system response regulator AtoC